MRRAVQRFYDWIFHAGVRRDPLPRGKAALYRYPSPGNILPQDAPMDYRTPFTDSPYDIRRNTLSHYQTREGSSKFSSAPLSIPPLKKLTLLGFLKQQEQNNAAAVEEAQKKFQQTYGFSVQESVFKNDFEIPVPKLQDRQGYRQAIAKQFAATALFNQQYANSGLEEGNDNPNIVRFQSLDIFDAPHFQQGRVENAYTLDNICNYRTSSEDGMDVRKGQAKFWKALDDSNDTENVKKVQGKIGDEEPTNFALKNAKVHFQFDSEGNVTNIHRKE